LQFTSLFNQQIPAAAFASQVGHGIHDPIPFVLPFVLHIALRFDVNQLSK